MLMRRASRKEDREAGRTPRTLREIDYLLKVNDVARMGALKFSEIERGPFLVQRNAGNIPPMIELPKLLAASDSLLRDKESDEELRILLAPGSSLGEPSLKHPYAIMNLNSLLLNFQAILMTINALPGKQLLLIWQNNRE